MRNRVYMDHAKIKVFPTLLLGSKEMPRSSVDASTLEPGVRVWMTCSAAHKKKVYADIIKSMDLP